jgi:Tol biopolymer transport system component
VSTRTPEIPQSAAATSTAFVAVPARQLLSKALFVVLSEDETKLLAAYEGQPNLQILYQISPPSKVQAWYHPVSFPVISYDGTWVTIIEDKERGSSSIYHIHLATYDENQTILDWHGPQSEASISPDGKRVAFLSSEGECPEIKEYAQRRWCSKHVYVMNIDGSNVKRLTTQAIDRCFLSWSPNSTQIVYREVCDPAASTSSPPKIYVVTLETYNNPKQVTQITASGAGGIWSPNGEWLQWTPYRNGMVGVTRLSRLNAEGKVIAEIDAGSENGGLWSPDSRRLLHITRDNMIIIWDIESGKTTTSQLQGVEPFEPQKWLPDGKRLVFRGQRIDSQGKLGEGQWFMVNIDGTNLTEFKEP